MNRLWIISLLLLAVSLAMAATIKKMPPKVEEDTDGQPPVLVLNDGQLTPEEKEIIKKIHKKQYTEGGKELDIMAKQRICDEFDEETERTGKQPKITDENKHCKVFQYYQYFDFNIGLFVNEGSNLMSSDVKSYNKGNPKGRKKRSFLRNGDRWTKCIIPFVIDYDSIPAEHVEDLEYNVASAQQHFETWTGFRFKPYTQDNSDYGLDHDEYLKFVYDWSCWSYEGRRSFGAEGQKISACGGTAALHELGHALGLAHEQQNPNSMPYLQIKYDNIYPGNGGVNWYLRGSVKDLWQRNATYDIGSMMHYYSYTFSSNDQETMTTYDQGLKAIMEMASNSYYAFRDLQNFHNCFAEFPPCPADLVCHNDGYPSIVMGQCQCRCPPGFDSTTNCADNGYRDMLWPEGHYSLLKPQGQPCPLGFEEGRMVHWSAATVSGSNPYDHSPAIDSSDTKLAHDVCTKVNDLSGHSEGREFPKGKYCVHRTGGKCPKRFTEGIRQTYGAKKPGNANDDNTGVLPDGQHGRLFEYIYCCREDGEWWISHRTLPIATPFILYSIGDQCQEIIGMHASSLEYFTFENKASYTGLDVSGFVAGSHSVTDTRFNVNFCYYTPYRQDCGEMKTFDVGETSFTFMSPNYPNPAGDGYRCFWHFTSPPGTKMQLDFEDMDIQYDYFGAPWCHADRFMEIKYVRPGAPGIKFCATSFKETIWTMEEFLTVSYNTDGSIGRGFKATVTVIRDEDMCYSGDGSDGSYEGPVDYAKSFDRCVPWSSVTHCDYHQFESRVLDAELSGNQCRNVGIGTSPWCYTDAESCKRETCDACRTGSCYDVLDSCDSSTHCNTEDEKAGCMLTCGLCASHVKIDRATCGPPGDVSGISPDSTQSSYTVGDKVTYTCPTQTTLKKNRVCTSEGTWSNLNYVCGSCPNGFSVFNKRCFKWLGYATYLKYPDAVAQCAAYGANVVKVDSQELQDWLFKILEFNVEEHGLDAWLGMTADATRQWRWEDGTAVGPYTKWATGEPGNTRTCATMRASDGQWVDRNCDNFEGNVVCEFFLTGADSVNEDLKSNCADVLDNTSDMCTQWVDFGWHNCRKTCVL